MYPFIYFQNFKISVYFLTLAIVYCIGIQYFFYRLKRFPLKATVAADLLLIIMVTGFLGARAFYVLYQEPEFYFENPKEILSVWNGGFIYYGGFLAALTSGFLFLKFKRQNIKLWLDAAAPVAALSYGLGRLACWFNGCCYGAVTSSMLGVRLPHLQFHRHPTQLYAVIYEILLWVGLLLLERKTVWVKRQGSLFAVWILFHALGRITMEYFRDDPRGELLFGFTISTILSGFLILSALTGLVCLKRKN